MKFCLSILFILIKSLLSLNKSQWAVYVYSDKSKEPILFQSDKSKDTYTIQDFVGNNPKGWTLDINFDKIPNEIIKLNIFQNYENKLYIPLQNINSKVDIKNINDEIYLKLSVWKPDTMDSLLVVFRIPDNSFQLSHLDDVVRNINKAVKDLASSLKTGKSNVQKRTTELILLIDMINKVEKEKLSNQDLYSKYNEDKVKLQEELSKLDNLKIEAENNNTKNKEDLKGLNSDIAIIEKDMSEYNKRIEENKIKLNNIQTYNEEKKLIDLNSSIESYLIELSNYPNSSIPDKIRSIINSISTDNEKINELQNTLNYIYNRPDV